MIIVITAVYKVFNLLNQAFKYLHWAELTDYTNFYKLAVSYVFDKQSEKPDFLSLRF